MDSDRASVLELRGGLPIGQEALWPSEPHHSPDKARPSYYTKNESFASGISKMWCVSSHFHCRGVFIGPWGSSTDLENSVWCQVVAGRPSHMAGRPGGAASTNFLHRPSLLLLVCVLKAVGQTNKKHSRPAKEFGQPTGPGALLAWGLAHSVHVSNTPP
jgi:hypothetical protein